MSENISEKQPLINKRLAVRFIIGLFAIAALIFGFQWYLAKGRDIGDLGTVDSSGWIAALELQTSGGAQAVIVKPGGQIMASPDYVPGKTDRDIVWRPDGNQVYFSSDRDGTAYNIYRWNVAKGGSGLVEVRTKGTISWASPTFSADKSAEGKKLLLCVSAGNLWERNTSDLSGQRLIPYTRDRGADADQKNAGSDTDEHTQPISIRRGVWGKDKASIIAVRRTETGEALVVQPMNVEDAKRIPLTVAVGDRIEFDVDAGTGLVVFSVQGFQWNDPSSIPAQYIKKGRAKKPYQHYIAMFDPADRRAPLVVASSTDPNQAFGPPRISPDGLAMVFTHGAYQDGNFAPDSLFLMPSTQLGALVGRVMGKGIEFAVPTALGKDSVYKVVSGEIYEPSWHPDGQRLVYVKRDGTSRSIYSIRKDGSEETRITPEGKNYASPLVSPQSK